ncbi:MAG: ribonuclease J [Chloroflexi bacterium]|nr:ribonuclease J [Chloroflexota bacterium]
MMVMEYENQAIIIDTGIMFPENDMLGIDYIIPDYNYLTDQKDRLKILAILITHGHEDHTGAIAHVVSDFNAPIYATKLTAGLLKVKLKNAALRGYDLNIFEAGDTLKFGPFAVESFHVCHSIPDCVGFGIRTPVGLFVHSGDYKFDQTPVDGWPTDFAKIATLSNEGVLALFADSTNADKPGWTPSESVIDDAFDRVFQDANGRIIIATFASLISRIQQVANAAQFYGRKLAVTGYSMLENIKMARKLGYLDIPSEQLISIEEANNLPGEEVVIMCTGAQGEPSAVLSRLATGSHRQLDIRPGDTVVMSAHAIPGNEESVYRIMNRLMQRGAHVIYDGKEKVHVSGHANQEEMKLLINLVRPKFFVPVHGELRHLHGHAELAHGIGFPEENIAVVENGTIIEFTKDTMEVGERVPGGYVYVDGAGIGDIGPAVLRDREALARDGFVVVIATVDSKHQLTEDVRIISRGFVYLRSADALFEKTRKVVEDALRRSNGNKSQAVQDAVSKHLYNETKRRPMVFTHIHYC